MDVMSYVALPEKELQNRLESLKLDSNQSKALLSRVKAILAQRGIDGLVSTLKALKLECIQRAAGTWTNPSPTDSDETLPRDSQSGYHKGVVGAIMRMPVETAIQIFMIYSAYVYAGSPSPEQWLKFHGSVVSPPPMIGTVKLAKMARPTQDALQKYHRDEASPALGIHWKDSGTSVPVVIGDTRTIARESELDKWLTNHMFSTPLWNIPVVGHHAALSAWCSSVFGSSWVPASSSDPRFGETDNGTIGAISCIQEPGLKLRGIANPNRIAQAYLAPLTGLLLNMLRAVDNDCTHDQNSGAKKVQEWLKAGYTVSSVDLSDATNCFPVSVQAQVIVPLLPASAVTAFKAFTEWAKSPWIYRDPSTKEFRTTTWTKGQPLGLGPSFPAFALAHHSVVSQITKEYVILGDDIVIRDVKAAADYRSAMLQLGCPIAETKSVTSAKLAEFAGKIILPGKIVHQYKYKGATSDNFLDLVENLGGWVIKHLPKDQQRLASLYYSLPEWAGGLGRNPQGVPLLEREALAAELEMLKKSRISVYKNAILASEALQLQGSMLLQAYHPALYVPTVRQDSSGVNQIGTKVSNPKGKTVVTPSILRVVVDVLMVDETGIPDEIRDEFPEFALGALPYRKARNLTTEGSWALKVKLLAESSPELRSILDKWYGLVSPNRAPLRAAQTVTEANVNPPGSHNPSVRRGTPTARTPVRGRDRGSLQQASATARVKASSTPASATAAGQIVLSQAEIDHVMAMRSVKASRTTARDRP